MNKMPFFLVLFVMLVGYSCDNEPYDGPLTSQQIIENPEIPDDFENSFFARLNNTQFTVNDIYLTVSEGVDGNNFIAITGAENNYHSIIVYLPSNITVGTYQYSPQTIVTAPNLNITYSNLANLLQSGIGNGSISITEHNLENNRIKGTFECIVNSENGSVQYITDGSFEIIY